MGVIGLHMAAIPLLYDKEAVGYEPTGGSATIAPTASETVADPSDPYATKIDSLHQHDDAPEIEAASKRTKRIREKLHDRRD